MDMTRRGFVEFAAGAAAGFSLPHVAWAAKGGELGTATASGYRRGRYVVNANNTAGNNKVYFTLTVDGTAYTETQSDTFDSLGKLGLSFGHCPVYYGGTSSEPCYMKGKLLRVAVSDIALDTADYVLDNLVLDTPKSTLAYWNFKGGAGLESDGVNRRRGALNLDGTSSATTTNLTLSALTQATIECFVCFGETPSSGAVFSLGSGAGSFSVAADATAGTLSGSFIPYDHLAASNGGTAALAPLAGKKTWHHVALVIDRTNPGADAVRFYVDYERTMPAGRAWDASARLLDGSIAVGDGFAGLIDDLRVSDGALERREFVGFAAGAAAGFSLPHVAWAAKGGARWYRGMIHAHTCWSDGRALPEQAVAAYKNGGYDFFSITDHNRIGSDPNRWMEVAPLSGGWPPKTIEPSVFEAFKAAFPDAKWRERGGKVEVRVSTMAEIAARFNEPGKFLFMPGCEVTTAVIDRRRDSSNGCEARTSPRFYARRRTRWTRLPRKRGIRRMCFSQTIRTGASAMYGRRTLSPIPMFAFSKCATPAATGRRRTECRRTVFTTTESGTWLTPSDADAGNLSFTQWPPKTLIGTLAAAQATRRLSSATHGSVCARAS